MKITYNPSLKIKIRRTNKPAAVLTLLSLQATTSWSSNAPSRPSLRHAPYLSSRSLSPHEAPSFFLLGSYGRLVISP